jgi:hypothetical protein
MFLYPEKKQEQLRAGKFMLEQYLTMPAMLKDLKYQVLMKEVRLKKVE